MQCGVPVITSDNSSLPEVVGDAGFMVSATDSDTLAQRMLELYSSSSLRNLMAQKSLVQASKFSWEKCVEDTITGYKTAINS
jgi:glycosyltransferase involved in cell wall biosynthesis